jgi:hypothetical protein
MQWTPEANKKKQMYFKHQIFCITHQQIHLLSEPRDKCEAAAKSEETLNGKKEPAMALVSIKE